MTEQAASLSQALWQKTLDRVVDRFALEEVSGEDGGPWLPLTCQAPMFDGPVGQREQRVDDLALGCFDFPAGSAEFGKSLDVGLGYATVVLAVDSEYSKQAASYSCEQAGDRPQHPR